MKLTTKQKESLKQDLISCLKAEPEIRKIVIFGSFLSSDDPRDLDVAVFQGSGEPYLPLALKYRQRTRPVSCRIPVDIFPCRTDVRDTAFFSEVNAGETIYER